MDIQNNGFVFTNKLTKPQFVAQNFTPAEHAFGLTDPPNNIKKNKFVV